MHPITLVLPPGLLLIVLPVVTIITVVMLIMATPRMLVFHVFIISMSAVFLSLEEEEASIDIGILAEVVDSVSDALPSLLVAKFLEKDDSEEEKDSTELVDITVNGLGSASLCGSLIHDETGD
ncbi:hypothetical protein BC943DRAFT_339425 [Umbelopsis sp. AD052]|nr:hypothetical protein BC943DRAFT_339425 [Umbelopsis sp. AD052]